MCKIFKLHLEGNVTFIPVGACIHKGRIGSFFLQLQAPSALEESEEKADSGRGNLTQGNIF